jgi:hypothetical protein
VRIRFSTETAAKAAVRIWERHGYRATRAGKTVLTDGPTLWAVSVLERTIGFDQVEQFDVNDGALVEMPTDTTPGQSNQAA